MITREQFLRGISAIQAHRELLSDMGQLWERHGMQRIDSLGSDLLIEELTRQLEERCNDPPDKHGSMIEYMLYEQGGPVHTQDGRKFMVNTPELLWDFWQETVEGPFSQTAQTPNQGSER